MDKNELYYRVAHSRLLDQEQRYGASDIKITGIASLSVVLVGISPLFLEDFFDAIATKDVSWVSWVFVALFALSAILVMYSTFRVLKPRKWRRNPNLPTLAGHLSDYDDNVLSKWVGDEMSRAVYKNESVLESKSSGVTWALAGVLGLVVSLVALPISLLFQNPGLPW